MLFLTHKSPLIRLEPLSTAILQLIVCVVSMAESWQGEGRHHNEQCWLCVVCAVSVWASVDVGI